MKQFLLRIITSLLSRRGYRVLPPNHHDPSVYDQDGLRSVHNHDFMNESRFIRAYQRGLQAGEGWDNHIHWRVHVALWVANWASRLPGDFVECGVNKGVISSAVMEYLNWNQLGKAFYLLDTFAGMDARFITDEERREGKWEINQQVLANGGYELSLESRTRNFAEWDRVHIIQGAVPETLPRVETGRVAYLHLDMNTAIPERAACEFFWPRLVPGGMILLDDYAYLGYGPQKRTHDEFASERGITVLCLPTGQGLMIKPLANVSTGASDERAVPEGQPFPIP